MAHIEKRECVAGFGHTSSLWFLFDENQMIGYTVETPQGHESFPPDTWFEQQLLLVKTTQKHLQKTNDILCCLTFTAGPRAVRAIRDYNVYELALAFTSHYDWQLINGAKILPAYGELAKVYAGVYAVYLFHTQPERNAALSTIQAGILR